MSREFSIIATLTLVGLVSLAVFIIIKGSLVFINDWSKNDRTELVELWNQSDYQAVVELCQARLENNSLDINSLIFLGFSNFYLSLSYFEPQEKIIRLDEAIYNLRKVLVLDSDNSLKPQIYYILGKSYFYKGEMYFDLAVKYIGLSIQDGYINSDSFDFMAKSFSQLGEVEKSISFLERIPPEQQSDNFLLMYAENLTKLKRYNEAETVLKRIIDNVENDLLFNKALFELAKVYYNTNKQNEAEQTLKRYMEFQTDVESHFLLGEIYFAQAKFVESRSEWRKTINLDNSHLGALERLENIE